MPKIAKELGPLAVSRLSGTGLHPVGGVAGLCLQIGTTGTRSWILRVKVGDKRKDIGLGAYPGVTLAMARLKARESRDQIAGGNDPVAQRAEARQRLLATQAQARAIEWTFERCAEKFIETKRAEWRNPKHGAQWEATLKKYVYPSIGGLSVGLITQEQVYDLLSAEWTTKTETLKRVRNRVEMVLDWATVRGFRQGPNPARWKGHMDKLLAAPSKVAPVVSHRSLPADECYSFMRSLNGIEGMSARCLEFVVMTACRSGEARLATWDELDLDAALWSIPGARMKSGRPHSVPLSAEVLALLESLPRIEGSGYVFPSVRKGKPLSDMALIGVMRRMGVDAVPHGFRATFSSWTASSTNYPADVREMALAHAVGDKTTAAYQRSDLMAKRRNLMSDWARYLSTPPAQGNVVSLREVA